RIPAWYNANGEFVVAKTKEEAEILFAQKQLANKNIYQDPDVLDTWASSWLWPISTFNGFTNEKDIKYFYPTNTLVTAPEILFFWVARMIIAGYEYKSDKPFRDVYLTGIVRDKQRRKMAKSLGNSPDPLDLIAQYGADAVRMGMLLCSPAGNDIIYDDKLVEQGRNFNNKIWNALRLIKGWEVIDGHNKNNYPAINWFEAKLNETIKEVNDHFDNFRISDALMILYNFIWDDFCAWYLEFIKPEFGKPIDEYSYEKTIEFFGKILQLMHPFMPFITEEIYHLLKERKEDIIISEMPTGAYYENTHLFAGNHVKELISKIRDARAKNNISPKEPLQLFAEHIKHESYDSFEPLIVKLGNLSAFDITKQEVKNSVTFISHNTKYYLVINKTMDVEQERKKLTEEIAYQKGFLLSVEKKLNDEKFVSGAPSKVIAMEKKKKADAEEKIKFLQESLMILN
ncbi:MAG: class I tRNA ligase family protein, partial [Fimbriimonadaceae bacterium]|nr:class I tRNA ligase family protein [Chitinophagales bacterium]